MKTAREVILERHQSAAAKLKVIRAEDLAACARSADKVGEEQQPTLSLWAIAGQLWQDMFWAWRRVWAGVAATWLVILGSALAAGGMPEIRVARPPRPDPEVLATLRQQEQLLAQLLGRAVPAPVGRPRTPGPRSAAEPPSGREHDAGRVETTLHLEVLARA